jgi:orotidine-5'-phosphate decarboxylase
MEECMAMSKIDSKIREKIVLALDVDGVQAARDLILELGPYVGFFKIGLQFYMASGNELFKFMASEGIEYFLDVKFLDIPNTVARASEMVVRHGANFFNVHALGGKEMMVKSMEAAAKTSSELGKKQPTVLGVTVLTSMDNEILRGELGINCDTDQYALRLAKLAWESGLSGVVASAFAARKIKEICGEDFKVLCPGIRPRWAAKNDQRRDATPKFAIGEGADYIVIGRAVTSAENHIEAMEQIYDEIGESDV